MDKKPEVVDKPAKMRGQNLVPFLAHLDKVRTEIEAGWPIKAVYQHYEATLDMSYIQFTRYVNRYIKQNKAVPKSLPVNTDELKPSPTPSTSSSKSEMDVKTPALTPQKPNTPGFKQFVPGPTNPDPKELW